MATLDFHEEWPNKADTVEVAGGTLYVYEDKAMFDPPSSSDGYEPDSSETWLTLDDLRAMRKALKWAQRRLAER
jgi:hypothetical protein